MKKPMEVLLIVIGIICYEIISWAFVASQFYTWFIIPIFPNLPYLNYKNFIGIILFIFVVSPKYWGGTKTEATPEDIIFKPLVMFFFGWVIHLILT